MQREGQQLATHFWWLLAMQIVGVMSELERHQQTPDHQGAKKKDMDSMKSYKLITLFRSLIFGTWDMGILPEAVG